MFRLPRDFRFAIGRFAGVIVRPSGIRNGEQARRPKERFCDFFPITPVARAFLALAMLALAGCGYRNSPDASATTKPAGNSYHWSNIYRQDVKTVAVPIFVNDDYQRGVEFMLTKAVINHLEASSPYKVVPRERADTILEGEIVGIRVNTLSQNSRSSTPQEQILDVTVNITWKDLRTGRILVSRRGMEQTATFYPTLGEGRSTGTQEATERLAVSIVQELQSDW